MEVCVYDYNRKGYSRLTLARRTLQELREAVATQARVSSDDVSVYKLLTPFDEDAVDKSAVQLTNTTEELPAQPLGVAYPVTQIGLLEKHCQRRLTDTEVHFLESSHYISWPLEYFKARVSVIWRDISALPTTSFFKQHQEWMVDGEFQTEKGGHSTFLKVFSGRGEPRVAKVAQGDIEYLVSQTVHRAGLAPHVLKIEAAPKCHDHYYLIMRPYPCTARDLANAFRQCKNAQNVQSTRDRLREHISAALQSLHQANYCYGPDLKLDNVLVDGDGSFVLCDFESADFTADGGEARDLENLDGLVAAFEKAATS